MERDDTANDAFKAFESVSQEMILALTSEQFPYRCTEYIIHKILEIQRW
jgi:hypothetical protein